jgi:hypothetical protein
MRNGKRLIAYYLPAFYPIPENDKNWGEGFTEWDNVRSARPLYEGHELRCFPHEDIGYYEMSLETLRRQQAMAKRYGLDGWAIYHYWFMGHEPYTRTLDLIMENPDLDLPFCLMWANEDWTRSWDGEPQNILVKQEYSGGDFVEFIRRMVPYFRDERYIRIDGKPVLMLYGPDEQFASVQAVWRQECASAGLPGLFLMHKTISGRGERHYEDVAILDGWDAVFDFPPRGMVDQQSDRNGCGVWDYRSAMACSLLRETDRRLFVSACTGWDNSPRKGDRQSYIMENSSPELFGYWLDVLTRSTSEDVVFINAWNEWGESAVLEPSTAHGYANLEALTAPAASVDMGKALGVVRGVACHWRGDMAYHAGRYDEAKRLWGKGASLGSEWCEKNLRLL